MFNSLISNTKGCCIWYRKAFETQNDMFSLRKEKKNVSCFCSSTGEAWH